MSSDDLLSDELKAKWGEYGAPQDVVLPSRPKKKAPPAAAKKLPEKAAPLTRDERRKSKSQERKERKVEEVKVKNARRSEIIAQLQSVELPAEQQKLLRASGALGHVHSAKEAAREALRRERAGLTPLTGPSTSRRAGLYQKLGSADGSGEDNDSDDNSDGDDDEGDSGGSDGGSGSGDEDEAPAARAASPVEAVAAEAVKGKFKKHAAAAVAVEEEEGGSFGDAGAWGVVAPTSSSSSGKKAQAAQQRVKDKAPGAAPAPAPAAAPTSKRSSKVDVAPEKKGVRWHSSVAEKAEDDDGEDDEDEDDDEEDSDEEDSDDDDSEGDEGDDDSGEDSGSDAAAAAPVVPPSAFSFSINLGGVKTVSSFTASAIAPAPAPAAAPAAAVRSLADEKAAAAAAAAAPNKAGEQEAAAAAADVVAATAFHYVKADEALKKLEKLRQRNAAVGLLGPVEALKRGEVSSELVPEDGSGASGGGRFLTTSTAPAWETDSEDDEGAGDGTSGSGSGSRKRRKVDLSSSADAAVVDGPVAADDLVGLRNTMWSADGGSRVRSSGELPLSAYSAYGPAHVPVSRHHTVAESRAELPVVRTEQEVMETLAENDVVVVAGETGSGKTTQIPQFLYEAGYGMPRRAVTVRADATQAAAAAAAAASTVKPQPLYAGYPGLIGVTQPRRVATLAMAARVGTELGYAPPGGAAASSSVPPMSSGPNPVAYQVRYDASSVSSATRIKFMTDGILLKEVFSDLLLRQYSVIIIDEAHERNVNTDILIGLLSRAVLLRNTMARQQAEALRGKLAAAAASGATAAVPAPDSEDAPLAPLKLIIMSATLRVSDFTENRRLFPTSAAPDAAWAPLPRPPPVVRIDARQYPVTTHFAKRTEMDDYLGEAFAKAVKIHTRLPEGGILVFLTGQEEVEVLVSRLRKRLDLRRKRAAAAARAAKAAAALVGAPERAGAQREEGAAADAAADADSDGDGDADAEVAEGGRVDAAAAKPEGDAAGGAGEDDWGPVTVLPLYALLPRGQQLRVFSPPPPGHRLIVVATNVAETSITIPGIRYVVDAGRVKRKVFDPRSGASHFEVGWVSKASADQRAGRAGRTGPGHCYRLYSSAVFTQQFPQFDDPEIVRMPIASLVLQMKSLGIGCVASFPFPTPPPPAALLAAVKLLTNLGALITTTSKASSGARVTGAALESLASIVKEELTPLGVQLARLPLHPTLGRMLLLAWQQQKAAREAGDEDHPAWDLVAFAAALAACMSVQSPLVLPSMLNSTGTTAAPAQGLAGHKRKRGSSDDGGSNNKNKRGGSSASPDDADEDAAEAEEDAVSVAGTEELDAELLAEGEGESGKGKGKDDEDGEDEKKALSAEEEKARAKRLAERNAAHAAHARLRHPLSDALTVLRAVGAHAYAMSHPPHHTTPRQASAAFCKDNYLRAKSMRELQQLRRQLERLLYQCLGTTHAVPLPAHADADAEMEADAAAARKGEEEGDDASTIADEAASVGASGVDGGAGAAGGGMWVAGGDAAEVQGDAAAEEEQADAGSDGELSTLPATAAAAAAKRAKRPRAPPKWPSFQLSLPPPTPATESLLRQLIAAGHLTQLAQRAPPERVAELCAAAAVGRGRAWVPYLPVSDALPGPLFVHPLSAVTDADPALMPPIVAYTEVSETKRTYLKGVTAVEESWLPALAAGTPYCRFSAPLDTPAPRYDARRDAVLCWCVPTFGDRAWRLQATQRLHPTDTTDSQDMCVRYFARGLLEGAVVPQLKPFLGPALAAPPEQLTKRAPHKRVLLLVEALYHPARAVAAAGRRGDAAAIAAAGPVTSAAALARVWRSAPGYLLTEIGAWLQEAGMSTLAGAWPAVVKAFLAAHA